MGMTRDDRHDFIAYCRMATDKQLINIFIKESDAGRTGYADLAESVANERGIAQDLNGYKNRRVE